MRKAYRKIILLIWFAGLAAFAASPVSAAAGTPAEAAETVRSALFNAQRELLAGSDGRAWLESAEQAYAGLLAEELKAAAPDAAARIVQGFGELQAALALGDAPAFAAARSETWTALLAGSFSIVEQAAMANDLDQARSWLVVREFRTATRFSRPNAEATEAIKDLANGSITVEDAVLSIRADLLDCYQALMWEALAGIPTADENGFAVRRAELAGLARGYFEILAPAYAEQRGQAMLSDLRAAFDELAASALNGRDLGPSLTAVQEGLDGFRAAPLSPEDQARRAGQLLRYVDLVAIEYGRGVSNGRVTLQFEIQEAVTFQQAAQAAFDDLKDLLREKDAEATAQAASLLQGLSMQLRSANTGGTVASAGDVRASADQFLETVDGLMPAEWKQGSQAADLDVIDSLLTQMENAVRNGEYELAESSRIEAYAIMEIGPEARLISMAPDLKIRVEELFWNGNSQSAGLSTLLANQASLQEVRKVRVALDEQLDQVEALLSAKSNPVSTMGNAAVIVFREGLEAVLILASLMSSLKFGQNLKYRRPLWLGSALALVATVLTWLLAREVLQALARYGEKLEAVVSLITIVVLLLVTNWFFHKNYWDQWLAGFHSRKRQLIAGEAGLFLGLVSLGFASVYREGFETVLFLQALILDGGTVVVLSGVAVGLALTALIGVLTFRFQNRLPHKKMLIVTGIMIGMVLLVMVGKTVHVFQLVGWLPASLIPGLNFPSWLGLWFGVYPSWEGLVLQVLAGGFVIASYYLAEHIRMRQRVVAGGADTKSLA